MEIGSATHPMSQLSGIASFGIETLKCYAFGAILTIFDNKQHWKLIKSMKNMNPVNI